MEEKNSKSKLKEWVNSTATWFGNPVGLAVTYLLLSIVLSITIVLRLNVVYSVWTIRLDVALYFLTYYLLPGFSFLMLFTRFHQRGNRKLTQKMLWVVYSEFFLCTITLLAIPLLINFPEYYIIPLPFIIILTAFSLKSSLKQKATRFAVPLLVTILVTAFFLPLAATTVSSNVIVQQASALHSREDQIRFISQKVLETTTLVGFTRSLNDFQKLLLTGDGACGEGSTFMINYLKKLGFEVREVGFPGEDHALIETRINSTWLVVDPGYSSILASEQARGQQRVQEAGTLTYVASYSEIGFIELTSQYTSTDAITIRVLNNGEPLQGVPITLVHTLVTDGNSRSMQLPGNGFSFHTDVNGTLRLHLGRIEQGAYNGSFTKTDPFYVVYVNGKPTDQKITSNGNGSEANPVIINLES